MMPSSRIVVFATVLIGGLILLAGAALAQDAETARKKCVEFSFPENTAAHERCVKQLMQSMGGGAPAKSAEASKIVGATPPAPALTDVQREEKYWDEARAVGNKEAFEAYLDLYPKGRYAGLARASVVRFNTQLGAAVKSVAAKSSPGQKADRKLAEGQGEMSVENRFLKQLEYKKNNKPVFIALDEFLVNLPGKSGEHYLQTKLVLRTGDASIEKRIYEVLPLVRNSVLAVLSARTVTELATVDGKVSMANDVALVINAIIEPQLTAIFILQQDSSPADRRNLERTRAEPAGGASYSAVAREAAAQFWKVTAMDLPVQAVLYNSLVMQ